MIVCETRTLITFGCDYLMQKLNPVGGSPEGLPDVPADGEATGVFSNAVWYWFRGYNGDGWDTPEAVEVALNKCGAMVCKVYPDLGVDLTHCNAHNDHLSGASHSRQMVSDVDGASHPIGRARDFF